MRAVRGLVVRSRRRAESLMVDTCHIEIVTGSTTNPADHPTDPGKVVPTYETVYSGDCKIQNQRLRYPSNPEAGEHAYTVAPTEVHLPTSAPHIDTGARVTITASFDAQNVGREFRVRIGDRKTFQSAIRLLVEEVSA